jgi:hypothetical protein
MSTPILRAVGPLRQVWSPADGKKLADDAAKHKPVKLRDWLWAPLLIFFGILLPGLAAPQAHADRMDSIICAVLDDYPTPAGVYGVGIGLIHEGYSAYNAGQKIASAVAIYCPEHMPEVMEFAKAASRGEAV